MVASTFNAYRYELAANVDVIFAISDMGPLLPKLVQQVWSRRFGAKIGARPHWRTGLRCQYILLSGSRQDLPSMCGRCRLASPMPEGPI